MISVFLFILGAALGSFLNVLALRYRPEGSLLARRSWGGRSRCPHCRRTLRFYELVPLLSFFIQAGRCRECRVRLSWGYPATEAISGLIVVLVSTRMPIIFPGLSVSALVLGTCLWLAVFLSLFLMSLVDLRLQIIPDGLQVWLGILGVALMSWSYFNLGDSGSVLGHYMVLFGLTGNILWNRLLGVALTAGFIGLLILGTRGKGMGLGDLKLAAALGIIFAWPDAVLVLFLGFVLGGLYGAGAIISGRKHLKTAVAFGPFLALAAFLVFVFGQEILAAYFSWMQIQWTVAG